MAMHKKGFVMEIIALSVIGIIAVLFFAGWIYGGNLINSKLLSIDTHTKLANISDATSKTYSHLASGQESGLELISFILIFGYAIASMIVAYFSRNHPILIVGYIFAALLMVIFSIYISNSYETLQTNTILGTTLQNFGITNWIMSYLPYWVGAISLICIALGIVGFYKTNG